MITELDLLMRALASRTRLRILAAILRAPDGRSAGRAGIRPAVIARQLHVTPSAVSQHLRVLLRLHLVRYWKRSSLKFYRPSRVRKDSVRGRLLEHISRDLPDRLPPVFAETPKQARERGIRRPKPSLHGAGEAPSLGALWADLTCYSHFRRILMLRHLQKNAEATVGELAIAADIHPLTAAYHVDKMLRRGEFLQSRRGLRLADAKPHPLRRIVRETTASTLDPEWEEPGS